MTAQLERLSREADRRALLPPPPTPAELLLQRLEALMMAQVQPAPARASLTLVPPVGDPDDDLADVDEVLAAVGYERSPG